MPTQIASLINVNASKSLEFPSRNKGLNSVLGLCAFHVQKQPSLQDSFARKNQVTKDCVVGLGFYQHFSTEGERFSIKTIHNLGV